jgi:hypothetical protein
VGYNGKLTRNEKKRDGERHKEKEENRETDHEDNA